MVSRSWSRSYGPVRWFVRFHGLRPGYSYDYTDDDLRPWADWLRTQQDGFAFFNNDVGGHAVGNAERLTQMISP